MTEQYRYNQDFLLQNQLGALVLDGYDAALSMDSYLEDIAFIPIEDWETRPAYARPSWDARSVTGKHEVHIRLGEPADVFSYQANLSVAMPESHRIMCERMGINPEDAQPHLLYMFHAIHEMGHASSFFDNDHRRRDYRLDAYFELASLPVPHTPASQLLVAESAASSRAEALWPILQRTHGIQNYQELVDLQSVLYRNLRNEAEADYFAADTLAANPDLMALLLEPSIGRYLA